MAHPEPDRVPAGRIGDFVAALLADERFGRQIAAHRYLQPEPARHAPLELDPRLREALAKGGVERLWTHQVEGIEAVRRGEHVVVMTPTASGKSLVYHVPVIESALADPESRALYVFPLKGLEQDQHGHLCRLLDSLGIRPPPRAREREPLRGAEVYDGDTPAHRRRKIRERLPNVVFTNPDMIHLALAPHHEGWAELFRTLRYVVIDEIHSYRGVFGSNAAQVFRRLRRICRYYGSDPRFIAGSATIANPGELAERLVGRPFRAVGESGAPRGGRHFAFLNPERSPYTEATQLLLRATGSGLRTIAFTKARRVTELVYRWTAERSPELAERIRPYRAGFLPRERREIERALFGGELLGVVATSALELGVDIGGLDVCILVGYPGSVSSTWQRAGRVGRHAEESLVVLVALRDALDQYFVRHPDAFFGRSVEAVVVDPDNARLLRSHLPCAASELWLFEDDAVYDVPALRPLVDELVEEGALRQGRRGDIWFSRRRRPEREVGIRSLGARWGVFDEGGRRIAELDDGRVFREAFPGAVYLHRGRQYRVVRLDLRGRRAFARPVEIPYYTQALAHEETRILRERERRALGPVEVRWGGIELTQQVVGYERRRFDGRPIGRRPLRLPPRTFETEALWLPIDPALADELASRGFDAGGSLHAAEHAAIKSIGLFAVCDPGDVGGLSYPRYPPLGAPLIFVYDGHEGGIGFTRRALDVLEPWLAAALELVAPCPCETGCPSCVQDPLCGSANEPLDKPGAVHLLRRLLDAAVR